MKGFFILLFLFFSVSASDSFKRTEKRVLKNSNIYILFSEKTPDYIIKNAIKKGLKPMFELRGNKPEWIRTKLKYFKNMEPAVILSEKFDELTVTHLTEISRFLDYKLTLLLTSSTEFPLKNPASLPIKSFFQITRKLYKGSVKFTLIKGNKTEQAKPLSASDYNDFHPISIKKGTIVTDGIYFKNHSVLFINIDNCKKQNIIGKSETSFVFSEKEKNIERFIEKMWLKITMFTGNFYRGSTWKA